MNAGASASMEEGNRQSRASAILVLGMHRSGTSACTRVINLLGAELGNGFLPPAADNPAGFWEHEGAYQIHERLLGALGRRWDSVSEMPSGWLDSEAGRIAADELTILCQRDFRQSPLWAVKDPRMCRLVPLWLEVLERLDVIPKALFMTRDPLEVAASLRVREGRLEGPSHLMWVQHLLEAERHTRGILRSMISYDGLMGDWPEVMARVGRELDINWSPTIEEATSDIDAFINPRGLRHHHHGDVSQDTVARQTSVFVDSLYESCRQVEAGRAGWDVLDDFQSRYARAADLFAKPVADNEILALKLQGDVHIWEAEAGAQRDKLQAVADSLDASRAMEARLVSDLEGVRGELSAAHASMGRQLHENDVLRENIDVERQDVARLGRELESVAEERQDLADRLESLQTQWNALHVNLGSRRWLLARLIGRHRS
jgi:hypothetical protein